MRVFHLFLTYLCSIVIAAGQDCATPFQLKPVASNNTIEWDKFPNFNLPFEIIYGGPRFNDFQSKPLQHGFSHLATFSGSEGSTLPVEKRAFLWYGVATPDGQPWGIRELSSPWNNDPNVYRNHWNRIHNDFANIFEDTRGTGIPKASIICFDIERMKVTDREIALLRSNELIPASYRALPENEFIATYKRDIRKRYAESFQFLVNKNLPSNVRLSSYSDTPVRGTWLNITANSWSDWTSNKDRTHYLMQTEEGNIGGEVYDHLDVLTPSPYYYYNYENPLGKDYLSYLLFQVEVNKAWSSKPVIPFVWLRYHDAYNAEATWIEPFMAEATAIFPFFSGASGLWLWDNPGVERENKNFATYEHFIYGLYRLSQFKHFFEGNYQTVIPTPARNTMEQIQPIWRGVVKEGKILIAAHHPYAQPTSESTVIVSHGNWKRTITLKGNEIHLCEYALDDIVTANPEQTRQFKFGPNPSNNVLHIYPINPNAQHYKLLVRDLTGRVVHQSAAMPMRSEFAFELAQLPTGVYVLEWHEDAHIIRQKWVRSN